MTSAQFDGSQCGVPTRGRRHGIVSAAKALNRHDHVLRGLLGGAVLLAVLTFAGGAAADDGLLGYWPLDGNGADLSGGGRDLNLAGGVGFAPGQFSQALALSNNGTQYAARTVDDDVFDFGANDFTLQVWVNFNDTDREQTLMEKFSGGSGPGWTLTKLGGNALHFYAAPAIALTSSSLAVPSGVWHHILMRRAGSVFQLYYDGSVVASGTTSGSLPDTGMPLLIGKRNDFDGRNFAVNGKIDDVAIWSTALTDAEIATLFNGGNGNAVLNSVPDSDGDSMPDNSDNCPLTPNPDQADSDGDGVGDACDACPATPPGEIVDSTGCTIDCVPPPSGMVSWWPGDDNANDIQGSNHGTLQNGATFTAGEVGQAFLLDGVDDYVLIPDPGGAQDLDGFSQLTIDAWIRPDEVGNFMIVTKYDSRFTDGVSYFFTIQAGILRFGVRESVISVSVVDASSPLVAGELYHAAAVWRGGDQLELYVDGAQVPATVSTTGTAPAVMANNSTPVNIGRAESSSGSVAAPFGHFKGQLDEVEIFGRALSAGEIQAIYDAGGAGKCKAPPDGDGDGIADLDDNCPTTPNADQTDTDGDTQGDACDPDDDNDGVADGDDNCPLAANAAQVNTDADTQGNVCDADDDNDGVSDVDDNCPLVANPDQADVDHDGLGDVCDPVNNSDTDGDGVLDSVDNCPLVANASQVDLDGDLVGDACDGDRDGDGVANELDNCPTTPNAAQCDLDLDGVGDECDADDDGDAVVDTADNCPVTGNSDQIDTDSDSVGNACDADDDNDGVADATDNCPLVANPAQTDTDHDGAGDACDSDDDNDGVADTPDNCPLEANASQTDTDGDDIGDTCDTDDDGDTIEDGADNCPLETNTSQADADNDGIGDACDAHTDTDGDGIDNGADNCPLVANPTQADNDGDGQGDPCDLDDDADGVADTADNCPLVPNTGQTDTDGDGQGNACDSDDDNDGVADTADNCPLATNATQADHDHDGAGDACDGDDDNDGVPDLTDPFPTSNTAPTVIIAGCDSLVTNHLFATGGTFSDLIGQCAAGATNHGGFVSCVTALTNDWKKAGLLTGAQKGAIVSCAAGAPIP